MKEKKLTIKFYLNYQKPCKNGFKIYMRVIYDQKKFELATQHYSTIENWEKLAERSKGPMQNRINKNLSDLENKVYRVKDRLDLEGIVVTAKGIKKALCGSDNLGAPNKRLIDYFAEFIGKLEKRGILDEDTLKTYRTSLHRHLKNYLAYSSQHNFLVNKLNQKFVQEYDQYLRSVALTPRLTRLKSATVKKQHEKLSALSKEAIKDGFIDVHPYENLTYSKKNDVVIPLNLNELTKIKEAVLSERLDRVRDIFIFSCYSGLRISDASTLTMDKISVGKTGQYYLDIEKQEKTGLPGSVPMFTEAVNILHKYKNSPERKVLNLALPKISDQNINKYLKEIAIILKINKHLTHKLSRHTFGTTVLQNTSLEESQKFLMHMDIKSTLTYKKVTVEQLEKAVKRAEKGMNL